MTDRTAVAKACLALATSLQQLAAALEAPAPELEPASHPADFDATNDELASTGAACGCSLYGRCAAHEAIRPKRCSCNGPFASSACADPTHRSHAAARPELDPALVG